MAGMTGRRWRQIGSRPFKHMLITIVALVVSVPLLWGVGGGALYRAATGQGSTPPWWDAVGALIALATYVRVVRATQHRAVTELAPGPALRELTIGVGIGIGIFSLAVGVLVLIGAYRISAGAGLGSVGPALTVGVMAGVFEELLFRGAVMTWLVGWIGGWGGLAVTSAFFGAAHMFNPGATVGSALAIAVEAGLLLGAARLVTGRLWLAIGLHIAWNFTEAGIFGVPLSGIDANGSLWRTTPVSGHDVLTGGAFGVEASPVAVVVCLAVAVPILMVARRRGRIPAPAWRQRRRHEPGAPATLGA